MEHFVPTVLTGYLSLFQPHFTKPSFVYFSGYILALLITNGRKTMNHIAQTCFFVDRHLSGWERFLAENRWDLTAVLTTLLDTLRAQPGQALLVHGGYLVAVDTLLIAKNGDQMPGLQKWKDHSGNADRGGTLRGHHWALLGLLSFNQTWQRYVCFPLLMCLVSGQLNPFRFMVDTQGVAQRATFWDSVLPLVRQAAAHLPGAPLRVVADAYFAKAPFIQPLLDAQIHLSSRLRKNGVGWDDPAPEQRKDAKHGRQWKLATLLDHLPTTRVSVHLYGKLVEVKAVCGAVWLCEVSRKVKVVVVEGVKEPILLLSTEILP